jgi:murein DD-endopeptidase MepM/ murein hydrolase activator NlpD
MYLILAVIFFLTLVSGLLVATGLFVRPKFWRVITKGYVVWIALYSLFIAFGTGPVGERIYAPSESSPYELPWRAGVSRFVSQGNRSFTSHRDQHLFAWDFWMAIGEEILAARAGTVVKVEQDFDGIGLRSNYVMIEHNDGSRAMYAHIRKNGSNVKVGDHVEQGQLIAYSGMVGQTINPHLHFVVFNKAETASLPITFSDVPGGVPLAGRFYTSANSAQ